MVNCRFNLRKANSDSETSINCIIWWDGIRLVYPTNLKINPKYWQSDKLKSNYQRAINTKSFSSHLELNAQLDNLYNSVKKIYLNYKNNNQNQSPSKCQLKNARRRRNKRNNLVNNHLAYTEPVDSAEAEWTLVK